MLTHLSDEDLDVLVPLFISSLEARGAKGRDNRLFLQAIVYFSVHSINWRALPLEFGNWNTVWKRFSRLSKNGTFERLFDALAECNSAAHLAQMIDSTVVRAHISAAGAKGGKKIRV
jgi:transposase